MMIGVKHDQLSKLNDCNMYESILYGRTVFGMIWPDVSVIENVLLIFWFVFFSSRRRHTRCLSDWSSDVCSSDLYRVWRQFVHGPIAIGGRDRLYPLAGIFRQILLRHHATVALDRLKYFFRDFSFVEGVASMCRNLLQRPSQVRIRENVARFGCMVLRQI